MTTKTFTIPAGGNVTQYQNCNSVSIESADGVFNLTVDKDRTYQVRQARTYIQPGMYEFLFENETASDITVTVHFPVGEMKGAGQASNADIGTAAPDTGAVTVGTTATLLKAANTNRRALTFRNNGGVAVYFGGSGVTVANGMPLEPGDAWETTVNGAAWYGIVASGTCDVRVVEQS